MTDEQKAKRRAWAASYFGDKNLTDEELDCATYMPSENFSDGWDKGVDFALSHQWVSTKERTPEPRSLVLVYVEGHPVTIAIWRDRYNCWHDEYDEEFLYSANEVKFWMPIPAIPQLTPEK